MLYIGVLGAFLISFGIVVYLTPKLLLLSLRKKMLDQVDSRKIHTSAASRFGGFSFFPAILLSVCLSMALMCAIGGDIIRESITLKFVLGFCSLFILYILGVSDDILGVRYRKKFLFQTLAAVLIVVSGTWIKNLHGFLGVGELPDYLGIPLTVLLIVLIANSINLIDGIDGLAALLSIIVFCVYGSFFLYQGALTDTLIAFAALGALVPFFYFNVFGVRKKNNSKIFMGDAGSLVIGFILAVMAVKLWNIEQPEKDVPYPYILSYTMLIVPCFDTIRVLFCRIKKHQPLFMPDNNHIHHILMERGFSQRKTLLAIVLIALFFLLLNTVLAGVLNITFIVILDIIIAVLFFKIEKNKTPLKA